MRTLNLGLILLSLSFISQAKQPNILFILVDDASPESYSAYGIEDMGSAQTPNIDTIAQDGVIFETALAPSICQPSRVQIMTGRYATQTGNYYNGIWHNSESSTIYQQNIPFSKVLSNAGYTTAVAGKWDAGPSFKLTTDVGFDEYFIYSYHSQIKNLPGFNGWGGTGFYEEPPNKPSRYWYPSFTTNISYHVQDQTFTGQKQEKDLFPSILTDYGPALEAKFLINFIERSVANEQPFLAYWPTVAPHGTGKGRLPSTPNRGDVGDLGNGINNDQTFATGGDEYLARYQALNEYLDVKIGEVLTKIKTLGIEENTIIIFASDNATAIAGKTRGVERGSHVALMMSGPGIQPRSGLTKALTDTSDLAPTLIEMAQAGAYIDNDYHFDGKSLMPFLTGETNLHREWVYANTAGSQILRSENYLLEAVNQLYLDYPQAEQGRFYFTAEQRFGQGYQLLDESSDMVHLQHRAKFQKIIDAVPLKPLQQVELSSNEIAILTTGNDTKADKHLFNDKYHQFYDETFKPFSNLSALTEQLEDADLDGMPDIWEQEYGFDIFNGFNKLDDKDQDGLTNLQEYQLGTNPLNTDTDGDTLPDGWEIDNQLNATDASDAATDNDNDGLSNLQEYQFGTKPNIPDSDGDTLPDGWEIDNQLNATDASDAATDNDNDGLTNLQEYQHNTKPNMADSDGDTLPDGWEVNNQLNATDASDATADNDNDGLTNLQEYQQSSDPNVDEQSNESENTNENESESENENIIPNENNSYEDKTSGGSSSHLLLIVILITGYRIHKNANNLF